MATDLPNITDDLAQRIRVAREALNLSQREAAKRLGVSERTLQNWEAGSAFPWPRNRRSLQRFLNRSQAA